MATPPNAIDPSNAIVFGACSLRRDYVLRGGALLDGVIVPLTTVTAPVPVRFVALVRFVRPGVLD